MKKDKCLYDILATEPSWADLHLMLVGRYKEAKARKARPTDEIWLLWSSEFNRYCRSIHEEKYNETPYTYLFAMWSTMTRTLEAATRLCKASGEVKRKKLKGLIDDNNKLYVLQKRKFIEAVSEEVKDGSAEAVR